MARLVVCRDGAAVKAAVQRLLSLQRAALTDHPPATLDELLQAAAGALEQSALLQSVQLRLPMTTEQRELFERLRADLGRWEPYVRAAARLGPERALPTVLWLFGAPEATWRPLPAALLGPLRSMLHASRPSEALSSELLILRSQIQFLLDLAA